MSATKGQNGFSSHVRPRPYLDRTRRRPLRATISTIIQPLSRAVTCKSICLLHRVNCHGGSHWAKSRATLVDHGANLELLLLVNGALLALCRRWIGKCKWARPQNECTQLVTRTIETPILSLRAGRDFFGVTNTCTTRGAQLAFGKTPLRRPQTLRGRAKTQPPGAGCPRDVRDELRSKSGVSATEY